MTTNIADLSIPVLLWLATYLVHSTLLLGAAWLVTRIIRKRSFSLQDQIWKLATVLPILTASIQQAAGPSSLAITQWTLAWPDGQAVATNDPAIRVARPDQRDGRGSHEESTLSRIPHEQPIAIENIETVESDIVPSRIALAAPSTPHMPTPDTDWTIDIQPGPAVDMMPELSASILETPVVALIDQTAIEPDEGMRSGGDEGTSLARQPPSPEIPSSPHHVIPSSHHPRLLTAAGALICLHLAFAALRLLSFAWREQRSLRVMVSGNDGPGRRILDQILTSRGIRRPIHLLYTRSSRGPAACGWRRWRIVLPAGLDHEMPEDELRALLAHELAHLVRRDTIWLWCSHALCTVLPLQPLNFLARRRWEETAEYLCDAWAVNTNVGPLTMAKCLTTVADRYLGSPAPVGLTAVGRQSTLSRRIERLTVGRISNPSHGRSGRLLVVLLSICVAAVTAIAAPRVVLEGDSAQLEESPSGERPPGDPGDEGMRSTGDEVPQEETIPPATTESQSELHNELQILLADLDRLNELLGRVDDSPEFSAAREQMQRRLQQIRERLAEEPLPNLSNTIELDSESSL